MNEKVKCLIIGSGPAGYTAAIYASRSNLPPVLYEGLQPGGQLTTTTEVDNFPGYSKGIDGTLMMSELKEQAERFGASIRDGVVTAVDLNKSPKLITIDDTKQIEADSVIICTGATAKYLGIPDETKYAGMGVSACATCDGFFYRNKVVAVVGGGDTACEEATYLSELASKVYMIVRKPYFRASQIMQDSVQNNPKIEILFECNTLGLFGDKGVEGAHLVRRKGESDEEKFDIKIDGFFLAIGHTPNTSLFKGVLNMNEQGYLQVEHPTTKTNVDGVFAAGDVADPIYKQAVTAAGMGCKAAIDADKYLQTLRSSKS